MLGQTKEVAIIQAPATAASVASSQSKPKKPVPVAQPHLKQSGHLRKMAANALATQYNNSTAFANVVSVIESYGASTNPSKSKTRKKRGHAATNVDVRIINHDLTKKFTKDQHDGVNQKESFGSNGANRRKYSIRLNEEYSFTKTKTSTLSPTSTASRGRRCRNQTIKPRQDNPAGLDSSYIGQIKSLLPATIQQDYQNETIQDNEIVVQETSIQVNSPRHGQTNLFSKTNPNSFQAKKSSMINWRSIANDQSHR